MCLWLSRLTVYSFSGSLGCDRPHFSIFQFLWHHALHILYCFTSMSFLYVEHSALICHCYVAHMKHFVLWHVDIDAYAYITFLIWKHFNRFWFCTRKCALGESHQSIWNVPDASSAAGTVPGRQAKSSFRQQLTKVEAFAGVHKFIRVSLLWNVFQVLCGETAKFWDVVYKPRYTWNEKKIVFIR